MMTSNPSGGPTDDVITNGHGHNHHHHNDTTNHNNHHSSSTSDTNHNINNNNTHNHTYIVDSDKVKYTDDAIVANYTYQTTIVHENHIIQPIETQMIFRTERKVPKLGVMLIGIGGNNGCTCIAGTIANKLQMTWETKDGTQSSNYWGSMFMSSTMKLGHDSRTGLPIYSSLHNIIPMIHPNDIIWHGWDINNMNLGDAMKRAKVLDYNIQTQLYPYMKDIVPLPSIYIPEFISPNQYPRANNILSGTKYEQMNTIRQNICDFRTEHELDKVILVWTATTERFTDILPGINDTADNLLRSIERNETEISASTIFAVASILEHCTFINGSPQNTFVPGVIDLSIRHHVHIAGDDFKSGQTKMKSVLVDFLVSAGIKPISIVSYNHLGNNDGMNLSSPDQFRSKEISKSNIVDDMVASNHILYQPNEHPDHVVVIKYVPAVADSKRAMDEYTSEIFMNGKNTIVIHNTCEDSLLAVPLIYDLIILAELCERITIQTSSTNPNHNQFHRNDNEPCYKQMNGSTSVSSSSSSVSMEYESFHPILSLLSYMLKAPLVPEGTPIVNALFPQREAILNVIRACLGLPPNNHMVLEHRLIQRPNSQYHHTNGTSHNNTNINTVQVNGTSDPIGMTENSSIDESR